MSEGCFSRAIVGSAGSRRMLDIHLRPGAMGFHGTSLIQISGFFRGLRLGHVVACPALLFNDYKRNQMFKPACFWIAPLAGIRRPQPSLPTPTWSLIRTRRRPRSPQRIRRTPVAVRTMAIVQVSVYEATNAITARYPCISYESRGSARRLGRCSGRGGDPNCAVEADADAAGRDRSGLPGSVCG